MIATTFVITKRPRRIKQFIGFNHLSKKERLNKTKTFMEEVKAKTPAQFGLPDPSPDEEKRKEQFDKCVGAFRGACVLKGGDEAQCDVEASRYCFERYPF